MPTNNITYSCDLYETFQAGVRQYYEKELLKWINSKGYFDTSKPKKQYTEQDYE
jgi:hypothetical protein